MSRSIKIHFVNTWKGAFGGYRNSEGKDQRAHLRCAVNIFHNMNSLFFYNLVYPFFSHSQGDDTKSSTKVDVLLSNNAKTNRWTERDDPALPIYDPKAAYKKSWTGSNLFLPWTAQRDL